MELVCLFRMEKGRWKGVCGKKKEEVRGKDERHTLFPNTRSGLCRLKLVKAHYDYMHG